MGHEPISGPGADHVMEMAGSSAAAELGLELLATGELMLAGTVFPSPSIPVDPERMSGPSNHRWHAQLCSPRFAGCHRFLEEGRNLPWDALRGGTMCLDQS